MAEVEETVVAVPTQRSYFATRKLNRYTLDDGISFIEHRQMDEGDYEAYQDLNSRIRVDAERELTEVDMALGKTRKFLREKLVTGWNLVEDGEPLSYSPKKLSELPPEIIQGLMTHIAKCNPILSGEDASESGKVQT